MATNRYYLNLRAACCAGLFRPQRGEEHQRSRQHHTAQPKGGGSKYSPPPRASKGGGEGARIIFHFVGGLHAVFTMIFAMFSARFLQHVYKVFCEVFTTFLRGCLRGFYNIFTWFSARLLQHFHKVFCKVLEHVYKVLCQGALQGVLQHVCKVLCLAQYEMNR